MADHRENLAWSAGNRDFLKIKKNEKWMWALMINRDIFLHGLSIYIINIFILIIFILI